jgi:hypothetical protein
MFWPLFLGQSEPAPTIALWRMDGNWWGNIFLLGSSSHNLNISESENCQFGFLKKIRRKDHQFAWQNRYRTSYFMSGFFSFLFFVFQFLRTMVIHQNLSFEFLENHGYES